MNTARGHVGQLSGTAAGGFLFAIARFAPFAVNVLTHTVSFFLLLFLRIPRRTARPEPTHHLGSEITAGFRWMWQHRRVRVIGLFAVVLNLFFTAYFIVIIVVAQAKGVPSGELGIMAAIFGVGGVLGSLAAPYLLRMLSPYVSIIAVFWALTALTPLAIFTNNSYVLGALFGGMAFLAPTADTAISTHQLLLTPDEMRGRMSAVMGVVIGAASVVGPALGGSLMELVSGNQAILLCAAGIGTVTLLATLSPTLRKFPRHATAGCSPRPGNE
jgi:predicted MFS family arabinose efflux permease